MLWILLSLLAAFGQALAWAMKKKVLSTQGINNTLGALSYLVAGSTLFVSWLCLGREWPDLFTQSFLLPFGVMLGGNILAVWAAYRALDKGSFSRLMPLMSLTALLIVPVEYFLRGVVPTEIQLAGMAIIIVGAFLFTGSQDILEVKMPLIVYVYFGITLIVYSLMPVFQALVVDATKDGLIAAALIHIGIGIGFLPLVLFAREWGVFREALKGDLAKSILWFIIGSGLVIGFLENGPATIALEYAHASEVFALKRTMPFFALLLGVFWFKEKIQFKHIVSTALFVIGACMIIWFR